MSDGRLDSLRGFWNGNQHTAAASGTPKELPALAVIIRNIKPHAADLEKTFSLTVFFPTLQLTAQQHYSKARIAKAAAESLKLQSQRQQCLLGYFCSTQFLHSFQWSAASSRCAGSSALTLMPESSIQRLPGTAVTASRGGEAVPRLGCHGPCHYYSGAAHMACSRSSHVALLYSHHCIGPERSILHLASQPLYCMHL